MSVTIISGIAGSGKTTHVAKLEGEYRNVLYHDEWVKQQLTLEAVKLELLDIFGDMSDYEDDMTIENIREWLVMNPSRNVLYSNFWKVRFAMCINNLLQNGASTLIECPFIDENIASLKERFPNKLVIKWIEPPEHSELVRRLENRGWSDERIKFSLDMQIDTMTQYSLIIDEIILSPENRFRKCILELMNSGKWDLTAPVENRQFLIPTNDRDPRFLELTSWHDYKYNNTIVTIPDWVKEDEIWIKHK